MDERPGISIIKDMCERTGIELTIITWQKCMYMICDIKEIKRSQKAITSIIRIVKERKLLF